MNAKDITPGLVYKFVGNYYDAEGKRDERSGLIVLVTAATADTVDYKYLTGTPDETANIATQAFADRFILSNSVELSAVEDAR